MKPFTRIAITVLSGLLVLLGFSGCRSTKKISKEKEKEDIIRDTIRVIKQRPERDPTQFKVVYGPPPSAYRKDLMK